MTRFFAAAAILVSLLALNTTADAGPMSGATTGAQPTIPTTSERAAKSRYQSGYVAMKRYQMRKIRQLESQDKLGNHQVQNLTADYNQAETLASTVQKKQDATSAAITGKIR